MFASQTDDGTGDFISVTIKNKHVELSFDTGSGAAVIRSRHVVKSDTWHHVTVTRKLRDGSLIIDEDPPISGQSKAGLSFSFFKLLARL